MNSSSVGAFARKNLVAQITMIATPPTPNQRQYCVMRTSRSHARNQAPEEPQRSAMQPSRSGIDCGRIAAPACGSVKPTFQIRAEQTDEILIIPQGDSPDKKSRRAVSAVVTCRRSAETDFARN